VHEEEGLDAVPVARQKESPAYAIHKHESEHSFEARKNIDAPLLVAVNDDFAVAIGAKRMAESP
jgi:hypothetical protein